MAARVSFRKKCAIRHSDGRAVIDLSRSSFQCIAVVSRRNDTVGTPSVNAHSKLHSVAHNVRRTAGMRANVVLQK